MFVRGEIQSLYLTSNDPEVALLGRRISKCQQFEALNSRGDQMHARNFVGHLTASGRVRGDFHTLSGKSRVWMRWSLGYVREPLFSLSPSQLIMKHALVWKCKREVSRKFSKFIIAQNFIPERSMSFVFLPSESQHRRLLPFWKKV